MSKIKVLVVDDTIIYRKILKDIVLECEDAEVIGTAPNGSIALKKISLDKPDLVLLDVEMPVLDGLETLKEIKSKYSDIGVIMVSGINERQANTTLKALSMGALDFVAKPVGKNLQENFKELERSLSPIISLFVSKKTTGRTTRIDRTRKRRERILPIKTTIKKEVPEKKTISSSITSRFAPNPKKFNVLVVGVSTGGPNALAQFIPKLPSNLGVPVLVVQHMPPMFTKSLAEHLNNKSQLKVIEASDNLAIEDNVVAIAPGGKHMVLRTSKDSKTPVLAIIDSPPVNSCKPSVDVLFQSIPQFYKGNILSLIMTGMGSDGANGVKKLKRFGCYSVTQSEESCVVYGMPRAVVDIDCSDEEVSLDQLAERITHLIKRGLK